MQLPALVGAANAHVQCAAVILACIGVACSAPDQPPIANPGLSGGGSAGIDESAPSNGQNTATPTVMPPTITPPAATDPSMDSPLIMAGDEPGDVMACSEQTVQAEVLVPRIYFVVDRSCSMVCPAGVGANCSPNDYLPKWQEVTSGLAAVLEKYRDRAHWGLTFFPDQQLDECAQGAPFLSATPSKEDDLISALMAAQAQDSALFPVGPCITNTGDAIEQVATTIGEGPTDPHTVILLTDGLEYACGANDPTSADGLPTIQSSRAIPALQQLADRDINTLVVGFTDGSKLTGADLDLLDAYAQAGGLPNPAQERDFYPVDELDKFVDLLGGLVSAAVTCQFELEQAAPADRLFIHLDDNELVPDMDYEYDAGGASVTLVGTACETFKAGGSIRAVIACAPREVR